MATTPQGLCGPCQSDLRFITRPVAHRETWRRQMAGQQPDTQAWEARGVALIVSFPADNADWICDFCNDPIPIGAEHTLIPLIGSYALCPPCVTKIPYWPDAWTYPTPRACPCEACQLPLGRQALRDRTANDVGDRRHWGMER